MKILSTDQTIYLDIDDTLVMHDRAQNDENSIVITDEFGSDHILEPNWTHIKQLKEHKAKGHGIVIWSAAGYRWAQIVVAALELEEYVDFLMSKPTWYYDDLRSEEFLPFINRVYFDNKCIKHKSFKRLVDKENAIYLCDSCEKETNNG